ncbi:MAG TPA: hypothetical protein ENK78_05595 [Thiothrix sp.]|nr:hypothetical protein [Thiothrix sp.]
MNYFSSAEVYADMPRLLRQFIIFAALWVFVSLISSLVGLMYLKSAPPISWISLLLLFIGGIMLGVAIHRHIERKRQLTLCVTHNSLCEDGYLEGYVDIKNAEWEWKADSHLYLQVQHQSGEQPESVAIRAKARLQPYKNNSRVHFSTVMRPALSEAPIYTQDNCSAKLYIEFLYRGENLREQFTILN